MEHDVVLIEEMVANLNISINRTRITLQLAMLLHNSIVGIQEQSNVSTGATKYLRHMAENESTWEPFHVLLNRPHRLPSRYLKV